MSVQPAARVGDDIAHSHAGMGLITGLVVGGVIAGAILLTGGLALVPLAGAATALSVGGLGGAYIGGGSMGEPCGKFVAGSPNVFINGRPATMTAFSFATCSKESGGPIPLATGSSTVMINGGLAGREGEKLGCSALSVKQTSPDVFIGGDSATDPRVSITPEVPAWATTALTVLGIAGAVMLLPEAIATVGLAATIGGGVAGYFGGKYGAKGGRALGEALGLPEAGVRTLEVAGGLLGGMVAGAAGTRGVQGFNSRYQIKVDPNALGMNGGNVSIMPRPQPGGRAQELGELFDPTHPRSGVTIGDRSVLADPSNRGAAKIFDGVSDGEVKNYFGELTGQPLPPPRVIPPSASRSGGELYNVSTPQGNYNLRNFSSSGPQTGAKWTIDLPSSATGTGRPGELKFR